MIAERILTSASGITGFLSYFGIATVLLALFALIYVRVTPYREFQLISGGNEAAAWSLGGALLGYVIPLSSAIIHTVGLVEMVVWGLIALVVQLVTFFVVRRIFPTLSSSIPEGNVAKGLFLGIVSVAMGILTAACMT